MENKKVIGFVLVLAGITLLVLSVIADQIGLGGAPGFGYKQIIGVVAGVVMAAGGGFLAFRK